MSVKEARYVIRLSHNGRYTPADCETLLPKTRALIAPLKGKAINLRISRKAIEFDLFCDPAAELHPFLTLLEAIGPTASFKRLDVPATTPVAGKVIAEARQLFNEERYWEAHEVLEGLWLIAKGEEKQLLQGWILTAAALVHAQKNEPAVADRMLQEALKRLQNPLASYYGLDVRRFLREVKKAALMKTRYFPTV